MIAQKVSWKLLSDFSLCSPSCASYSAAQVWRPQVAFSSWFQSHVFWRCSLSTATWSSSTTCWLGSTVCRWAVHVPLKWVRQAHCCCFPDRLLFVCSPTPRVPLCSSSALSSTRRRGMPWNTAAAASARTTWSNPRLQWVSHLKTK